MEGALIKLKSGVYCRTFSDLSGLVFFSARTCETFFVHQSLKRSVKFSNANNEMTVDEFIGHFQEGQNSTVDELEARGLLVRV